MNSCLRLQAVRTYKPLAIRGFRYFTSEGSSDGSDNRDKSKDLNEILREFGMEKYGKTPDPKLQSHRNVSDASDTDLQLLKKTAKMFDTAKSKIDSSAKVEAEDPRDKKSFAALLRESNFIGCGDARGRVVIGKIFEVLGDDLYIDFGGKFHCVCPRPKANPQ